MVWVSRWCKVDTGDPFLDTDVSDLLYLWQGDVQKFFDCGFGAILCPEVSWSRIENTWDFWIWMGLDRCFPAFSRAFMDHSLISSMVPVPWLRLVRRDAQLEISLPRLWSLDEGARDLGWKVERPNSLHWDRSRLLSVASWWSFGSSIKLCFFDLLGPPFAQAVFVFGCTCVTQAPRCGRTISTSKHLHYMPMSTLNSSTCKLKKKLSGTCVSSLNVACWVFG